MSLKNSVQAIVMQSFNSANLTGAGNYFAINAAGLTHSCFYLRVVNAATTPVIVSYDGVNPHDYIFASNAIYVNSQANAQPSSMVAKFPEGQVIYVAGTAGVGTIYVVGYYQPVGK